MKLTTMDKDSEKGFLMIILSILFLPVISLVFLFISLEPDEDERFFAFILFLVFIAAGIFEWYVFYMIFQDVFMDTTHLKDFWQSKGGNK